VLQKHFDGSSKNSTQWTWITGGDNALFSWCSAAGDMPFGHLCQSFAALKNLCAFKDACIVDKDINIENLKVRCTLQDLVIIITVTKRMKFPNLQLIVVEE